MDGVRTCEETGAHCAEPQKEGGQRAKLGIAVDIGCLGTRVENEGVDAQQSHADAGREVSIEDVACCCERRQPAFRHAVAKAEK